MPRNRDESSRTQHRFPRVPGASPKRGSDSRTRLTTLDANELVRLRPAFVSHHRSRHDGHGGAAQRVQVDARHYPIGVTPGELVADARYEGSGVDLAVP